MLIDERLRELSLGSWDGLTYAEIEAGAPGSSRHGAHHEWYFRSPDGESSRPLPHALPTGSRRWTAQSR